mmetsp:Transcript_3510/g.4040  ORF Transcript_3510/g.4040 Transcript_3510/m.4040 type:complete len:124 (-) Transcript_3510:132-503(-)
MHRVPNVSYILHVHQHFDHSYLFHGRTFCLPPVGLHHHFQLRKIRFHVVYVCYTWYYLTFKTILSVSAGGGCKKKIAFWRFFTRKQMIHWDAMMFHVHMQSTSHIFVPRKSSSTKQQSKFKFP